MVTTLHGTPVVAGVALGPALVASSEVSPAAIDRFGDGGFPDDDAALAAYDAAVAAVAAGFERKAGAASGATAQVLAASAGLVTDRGLRSTVAQQLQAGNDLLTAIGNAVEHFVGLFTSMGGLMAERATDLRDIHGRLLAHVVGEPEPGVPVPEEPSVLVAADLAPADTAVLDPALVVALATERGGPTSHTAIIARQLGIPCVVGVAGVLGVEPGTRVLVDGASGVVEVDPDPGDAEARVAADREERAALAAWTGPGRTADGREVKLMANVADAASATAAAGEPVAGVGLFRTELCFLNRDQEPTVEEQAAIYTDVLAAYGHGRPVVVRTLDAGSDKPISFATHPDEENPALGVRGLRLSFDDPGLLHRQLDAVAEAARRTGTETWVMAPMVATAAEARDFATAVRDRGLRAGVMVEVPSAALLAHQLLAEVDFLSIGTNDLTQYTMAADRMASDLAHLTDPWQPAVLHLVAITAAAGREAGKPVGVCGEAAADPLLAAVLVGMGVTSLSMAAAAVRPVGARLARTTYADCEAMAEAALAAEDPAAARQAARDVQAAAAPA
ncbi:phosphoenolpyruvate--protein phosphotransferase [Nocardioides sp. TF02-7]|uniref:phosphoenolpyruvate--protein phosphotransferase n=1 Tax=Nocardioides sp. TF02-7 TaxID=2917724 RepID=UPI001F05D54D|nr:phosphoenolpyruvate--protein phosphotransferase [Nocardioides sp. TF02-7]UMG91578.1 phosphoenolpyruvate--protein phosphotransferase [Nocardioides sp. TF02-7]